jgi:hypothetical protein
MLTPSQSGGKPHHLTPAGGKPSPYVITPRCLPGIVAVLRRMETAVLAQCGRHLPWAEDVFQADYDLERLLEDPPNYGMQLADLDPDLSAPVRAKLQEVWKWDFWKKYRDSREADWERWLLVIREAIAVLDIATFEELDGNDWDALGRVPKAVLTYMRGRERASTDGLAQAVWDKGAADLSDDALGGALRRANEFLEGRADPRRLRKARGEPVVLWAPA